MNYQQKKKKNKEKLKNIFQCHSAKWPENKQNKKQLKKKPNTGLKCIRKK